MMSPLVLYPDSSYLSQLDHDSHKWRNMLFLFGWDLRSVICCRGRGGFIVLMNIAVCIAVVTWYFYLTGHSVEPVITIFSLNILLIALLYRNKVHCSFYFIKGPELYKHYVLNRKLSCEEKAQACELTRLGVDIKVVQQVMQKATGKQITTKDVWNLKTQMREEVNNCWTAYFLYLPIFSELHWLRKLKGILNGISLVEKLNWHILDRKHTTKNRLESHHQELKSINTRSTYLDKIHF